MLFRSEGKSEPISAENTQKDESNEGTEAKPDDIRPLEGEKTGDPVSAEAPPRLTPESDKEKTVDDSPELPASLEETIGDEAFAGAELSKAQIARNEDKTKGKPQPEQQEQPKTDTKTSFQKIFGIETSLDDKGQSEQVDEVVSYADDLI